MTDSQSLSLSLNNDNLRHEIATHLHKVGQTLEKNVAELDRQDGLNKKYIRQLNQIDQYLEDAESALTLMKEKHLAELKHSEEQAKQREEQAKLREAFIQQQIDSIERHLQQSQTELNRATEILRTMKNIQTEKSE